MAEWKYKLETQGKQLREFIDGDTTFENALNIIGSLRECCKTLMKRMGYETEKPGAYAESFYELDMELENTQDNLTNYQDDYATTEDIESEVNYYLNEFYNLCDNAKVWVGLGF